MIALYGRLVKDSVGILLEACCIFRSNFTLHVYLTSRCNPDIVGLKTVRAAVVAGESDPTSSYVDSPVITIERSNEIFYSSAGSVALLRVFLRSI